MSYLKSVTITGFKSFETRQEVKLCNQFNCIVGENGCGKSNLIDGICLCLSINIRKLRVSKVSELLFSRGVKNHKVASVSLKFSDKSLVQVNLFSDSSQRKYLLNGKNTTIKKLRRYLNNKLGISLYNLSNPGFLIMQNNVVNLPLKTAKELAELITDSTGGKLFDKTVRKTEDDIKGIDIECKKIVGKLKILREYNEKGEKLLEKKELLDEIKDEILINESLLKEYKKFMDVKELSNLKKYLREQKNLNFENLEKQKKIEKKIGDIKERKKLILKKINDLKVENENIKKDILKFKKEKIVLSNYLKDAKINKEINEKEKKENNKKIQILVIQNENRENKIKEIEKKLKKKEFLIKFKENEMEELEELIKGKKNKMEGDDSDDKSEILAQFLLKEHKELVEEKKEIEDMKRDGKINKIKDKIKSQEKKKERLENEILLLKEKVVQMDLSISGDLESEESLKEKIREQKKEIYEKENKVFEIQSRIQKMKSQESLLTNQYKGFIHMYSEYSKFGSFLGPILNLFSFRVDRFSENGKNKKKKENLLKILNLLFSKYLNVIVLKNSSEIEQILDLTRQLKKNIVLWPLDRLANYKDLKQNLKDITNQVGAESGFEYILKNCVFIKDLLKFPDGLEKVVAKCFGRYLVVENDEIAEQVIRVLHDCKEVGKVDVEVMTYDGNVHSSGKVMGGYRRENFGGRSSGVNWLEKKFSFVETKEKVERMEKTVVEIEKERFRMVKKVGKLEKMRDERERTRFLREKVSKKEIEVFKMDKRIENLKKEAEVAEEKESKLRDVMLKINDMQKKIEALTKKESENGEENEEKIELFLEEKKMEIAQLKEERRRSMVSKLEFENEIESDKEMIQELEKKNCELSEGHSGNGKEEKKNKDYFDDEIEAKGKYENLVKKLSVFEKKVMIMEDDLKNSQKQVEEMQKEQDHEEKEKERIKKECMILKEEIGKKEERIHRIKKENKKKGNEYFDENEEIKEEEINFDNFKKFDESFSSKEIKFKLKNLNSKQKKFAGEVRVESRNIDVHSISKISKQIKEFETKLENLQSSIKILQKGIENSMKFVHEENERAFTQISKTFRKYFKYLIPNKSAKLMKSEENMTNNVEDGIKFFVKDEKGFECGLSQLSGGQKTLMSLALVFAIAKYSKCPMYIFDEIDAALDEKNQILVAKFLHENFRNVQLVSISHNEEFQKLADRVIQIEKKENASRIKKIITIRERKS